MRKMQSVMTIRLPSEDLDVIREISKEENKDKSTSVRDLIDLGKIYFAILKYADGKISLGKASEIANLTISDMMGLLSKLGIRSKLDLADYLEGTKTADKII